MKNKEDAFRIGKKVLSEDDLEFQVEYKGELFTLKYPTPYERALIEAEIARRLQGYPRSSFTPIHIGFVEATSYVNELTVYEKSPNWFKSAWTCHDELCITKLFEGYLQFRREFQERIRGDSSERSSDSGSP